MATVRVETWIEASPEVCFDLARDVDAHARTLAETGETVTERPPHRLLEKGDVVTFRGRHFGIWFRHRAQITALERPRHFCDEMLSGAFRRFVHDHDFTPTDEGTQMTDTVSFRAPGGPIGWLVDRWILVPYLARVLRERGAALKREAEAI